jgi:RimJ/RimL family protein N-acetyltransferase
MDRTESPQFRMPAAAQPASAPRQGPPTASPKESGRTILHGRLVELVPMDHSHFEELFLLALDKRIWEFLPFDGSKPDRFLALYTEALENNAKGLCYPFVILDKATGGLAGTTRLLDLVPKDRKLEIGHTWLHPDFWGSGMNTESKLLLLTFCFETLKTVRVQLRANEVNLRSRRAIEKIGATFEGILRKDKISYRGVHRNSAYYSIIDDEWPRVKANLSASLYPRGLQAAFRCEP